MGMVVETRLRTIKLEADYQRGRLARGDHPDDCAFRLMAADEEIDRLRTKLDQITSAVGIVGGQCINCDVVRILARVALTGE